MNIRWPSAFFKSKFWIIFRMPSLAKSVFDKNWLVLSKSSDDRLVFRSRHRKCFVKKYVLRNFAKFAGKHLCQSLCFNKVAGLLAMSLKRRLGQRHFSCEFCEISGNTFCYRTPPDDCFWMSSFSFLSKTNYIPVFKKWRWNITYLFSKNEGWNISNFFITKKYF